MDSDPCESVFEPDTNSFENVNLLFQIGDGVLARRSSTEELQQALVLENDAEKCQSFLETKNGSCYWADWASMTNDSDDRDVVCDLCASGVSHPPNYIVLCDKCGKGYHQSCHDPVIGPEFIESADLPWFCAVCGNAEISCEGEAPPIADVGDNSPVHVQEQHQSQQSQSTGSCAFPYKLESLHWEDGHRENLEKVYCYCGEKGSWEYSMLQCVSCLQWFHQACLKSKGQHIPMLGCRFYTITCAVCTQSTELRHRYAFQWIDVALLIFFNLTSLKHCFENGRRRCWLDFWVDVVPFLDEHWSLFAWGDRQFNADEKHRSLLKALLERSDLFWSGRDYNKRMSLFRFADKNVPAPQPDTKGVSHGVSPIPYHPDNLPTAANLYRFTLSKDHSPNIPSNKRKRAPRSTMLTSQTSPLGKLENSEDSLSPESKRAFSLPSTPSICHDRSQSSPAAVKTGVLTGGKLMVIPQGCARKSADAPTSRISISTSAFPPAATAAATSTPTSATSASAPCVGDSAASTPTTKGGKSEKFIASNKSAFTKSPVKSAGKPPPLAAAAAGTTTALVAAFNRQHSTASSTQNSSNVSSATGSLAISINNTSSESGTNKRTVHPIGALAAAAPAPVQTCNGRTSVVQTPVAAAATSTATPKPAVQKTAAPKPAVQKTATSTPKSAAQKTATPKPAAQKQATPASTSDRPSAAAAAARPPSESQCMRGPTLSAGPDARDDCDMCPRAALSVLPTVHRGTERSHSHAADWALGGQPTSSYKVLGVRTLPSGHKQFLLDWNSHR
ncbi:mucin-2-like [Sycon ciliatum]|uniref:mucin-2-like n=1 Tax=Sycon ciliatum TaxID=27933 RepID=UPI0031F6D529